MTAALNHMKQWGQNFVSAFPGNREKLEPDPILEKCKAALNELNDELQKIRQQFANYAEQQVNATEATVILSKTINNFYARANHPGRAESVNAYKQVQEDIATRAVKSFHIDVESGLLAQLGIWVENIKRVYAQIEEGERARIAAYQTANRLQTLTAELQKKKQQPSNNGSIFGGIGNSSKSVDVDELQHKITETANVQKSLHQDFVAVRTGVERQVKAMLNQRFIHFDRIYVQILECQLEFYQLAAKQTKRFQTDIDYYRAQFPKQDFQMTRAAEVGNKNTDTDNDNDNDSPQEPVSDENLNNKPPNRSHRRQPSPLQKRGGPNKRNSNNNVAKNNASPAETAGSPKATSAPIQAAQQALQQPPQAQYHQLSTIQQASLSESQLQQQQEQRQRQQSEDAPPPAMSKQETIHADFLSFNSPAMEASHSSQSNHSANEPPSNERQNSTSASVGMSGLFDFTEQAPTSSAVGSTHLQTGNDSSHQPMPSENFWGDYFTGAQNANNEDNGNNTNTNTIDNANQQTAKNMGSNHSQSNLNNHSNHNDNTIVHDSLFGSHDMPAAAPSAGTGDLMDDMMRAMSGNNDTNDDRGHQRQGGSLTANDPSLSNSMTGFIGINGNNASVLQQRQQRSKSLHTSSTHSTLKSRTNNTNTNKTTDNFQLSASAQARVDAVVAERVAFVDKLQANDDEELRIRHITLEKYDAQLKQWEFDDTVRRNIRTLLCKLPDILPSHLNWKPMSIAQLLSASKCKKAYFKAVRLVHPDKVMQRKETTETRVLCERIFQALECAFRDEFQ